MEFPDTLTGRSIKLSETREVWLCDTPFEDGSIAVQLTNRENADKSRTSLRLSAEALDALVAMRTNPLVGEPRTLPVTGFVARSMWRIVRHKDAQAIDAPPEILP